MQAFAQILKAVPSLTWASPRSQVRGCSDSLFIGMYFDVRPRLFSLSSHLRARQQISVLYMKADVTGIEQGAPPRMNYSSAQKDRTTLHFSR